MELHHDTPVRSDLGPGTPDIKKDAMLDIRVLLDQEVVKAYNTTEEDLEQVLIESVEYEEDGTEKKRFRPRRDAQGRLTDMAVVQGHGDDIQERLDENQYMTPAFWGDGLMTEYILHGTQVKVQWQMRKKSKYITIISIKSLL